MTAMPSSVDQPSQNPGDLVLPDLLDQCRAALDAAQAYEDAARQSVAALVAPSGRLDGAALDRHQNPAHGLAWTDT
jgi:(2S)-methylsuccinyl-CoA dehydrogenase